METFELIRSRAGESRPDGVAPRSVVAGRFAVRGPLGVGGMTWVWEADDARTGQRVALKVLKNGLLAEGAGELLQREAELLARIDDRAVPRVVDVGEHEGVPYLACTLIEGTTLENRLQLGSFAGRGWADIARFSLRLARALGAAHAEGVLHRDLNARNVMVRQSRGASPSRPVLIDFGLGRWLEGEETGMCRRLAGNLHTLAPEQIRRRALGADPRTDIYQFGLLLYRLLTGRGPFTGPGIGELVDRILTGSYPRPGLVRQDVPQMLERVCVRTLASDPARRYASAEALCVDLLRAVASVLADTRASRQTTPGALSQSLSE